MRSFDVKHTSEVGQEKTAHLGSSLGASDAGLSGACFPSGTRVWARPLKQLGLVSIFAFFATLEMGHFAQSLNQENPVSLLLLVKIFE